MNKALIAVLIMAFVTYLPRVVPMVLFRHEIKSKKIKAFLNYVPYAVLAAMTFPDIFYSTSCLVSAIAGTTAAVILSLRENSLVVVAVGAIITVFISELLLSQMHFIL